MEENRKRTELIKEHTVDLLPLLSPRLIVLARQALKDLVLSHKVNLLKVSWRRRRRSIRQVPIDVLRQREGWRHT